MFSLFILHISALRSPEIHKAVFILLILIHLDHCIEKIVFLHVLKLLGLESGPRNIELTVHECLVERHLMERKTSQRCHSRILEILIHRRCIKRLINDRHWNLRGVDGFIVNLRQVSSRCWQPKHSSEAYAGVDGSNNEGPRAI